MPAMQTTRRFDWRTLLLLIGAAVVGLIWANYNRVLAPTLSDEAALRPHVWAIFGLPFALCIGWLLARRRELWLALAVCFCIYFFSAFVAARYESCAVVTGRFDLNVCFTGTAEAQEAARRNGHTIYFQSILVVQALAALVVALQRAWSRSTMPDETPQASSEFTVQSDFPPTTISEK